MNNVKLCVHSLCQNYNLEASTNILIKSMYCKSEQLALHQKGCNLKAAMMATNFKILFGKVYAINVSTGETGSWLISKTNGKKGLLMVKCIRITRIG